MRIQASRGFRAPAGTALLAPVFGLEARAQAFLGEWTATAEAPGGGVSERITAVKTQKGFAITVKLADAPPEGTPEAGPGMDIVLDGDKFSYRRSIFTPNGTLVITYSGEVSGDTFTGTVDLDGFAQAPYNGVRVKR